MKKLILSWFSAIALFGLMGCETIGDDESNLLIGTWKEACRIHEVDEYYQIDVITFKADNTFDYNRTSYSDKDCKNETGDKNNAFGTYKEEGSYTDSEGKKTVGLIITPNGEDAMYTMYRLNGSENLLIADSTDGKDGSTSDSRKNYIDSKREGAVKL
jgi:hypothetical protein